MGQWQGIKTSLNRKKQLDPTVCIFPALLQKGKKILPGHIGKFFTASVVHGHVPKTMEDGMMARVLFIPKPEKENHYAATSYRPISLTSFRMKTLEKLIDMYNMMEEGPICILLGGKHFQRPIFCKSPYSYT